MNKVSATLQGSCSLRISLKLTSVNYNPLMNLLLGHILDCILIGSPFNQLPGSCQKFILGSAQVTLPMVSPGVA